MKIALNWLRVCCVAALLALSGLMYTTEDAVAQETMKQKVCIECWIKCCPLNIGCQGYPCGPNSSAARKADSGAQITVTGKLLVAEFKPTGDQKIFEVKQETKLDAETASALGYKEITMLPGQYPVTKLDNGKAKVTIKVKTLPKTGYDLKENKGKSKN
ncbi:MAG: hypothetical protein AB7U82_31245 [Blastocatellales bacterium]